MKIVNGIPEDGGLDAVARASISELSAQKGAANGIAQLDADQRLPESQLPAGFVTDVGVVADRGVTLEKLNFLPAFGVVGKNKFNKNNVTNGKYIWYETGVLTTGAEYCATEPIPITPGTTVSIRVRNVSMYALYDSSMTFISGDNPTVSTFTIPTDANIAFMRMTVVLTDKDTQQIEFSTTATDYEPYKGVVARISNTIHVAKSGGDFTKISDAVNNIMDDSATNTYTIIVHPGVYEEIVHIGTNHYISIVGINRDTCILIDNTGTWANSPLSIACNCRVENMTIISTHDDNAEGVDGYALHADTQGSGTVDIFNCKLISYQSAAVGIGLFQDRTVKLTQCELYSYTAAGAPNITYGALLCHPNLTAGVTNQHLIVKDCILKSQNGIAIYISTNASDAGMDVAFYNNLVYSSTMGKVDGIVNRASTIALTADSFGNNVAALNA